ncbi:hypothetical protein FBU30_006332 [Linnemannia zychae]|nr:hypothetical protein FBU30_006332 [Linnemannia zychae]
MAEGYAVDGHRVSTVQFEYEQPIPTNNDAQTVFYNEGTTVLDILGRRPEFSKLLELIQKDEDLTNLLGNPTTQPTLFAPTNEAFDSVSDIDYPTREVLMYHITAQPYNLSRLHDEFVVSTLFDSPGLNNSPQKLRISLCQPGIPSTSDQGTQSSLWKHEPEVWMSNEKSQKTKTPESGIFINRAKVTVPDLFAESGAIVHGVNRIIFPPGEAILDEIERRSKHFSYLIKSWTETGVDGHVRDGKSMTLFAAPDKAWKALPKKLVKWLFSDGGREHLKIFAMYQIANKVVYTPEILNKTNGDGKSTYPQLNLPTLLHSPAFELHVQGKAKKPTKKPDKPKNTDRKPLSLIDLIEIFKVRKLLGLGDLATSGDPDHHFPHKDPDHPHHHPHRDGKHHDHRKHCHHRHYPHSGDDDQDHKPPGSAARRDDIVVNGKAQVIHGLENWVAGNGVIHVVDKVLMPPRSKGCEKMTAFECSAWETMWDLVNIGLALDDTADWFDEKTIFEDVDDEHEVIEDLFQSIWNADEDLAEMKAEKDENDY